MSITTVRFQSGATRDLDADLARRVQGLDAEGRVVVDDGYGYLFGLTLCCNAYDKGAEDRVVCRHCYGTDDIGRYGAVVTDPKVPTVEETVAKVKAEVLADIADGTVPATVATYSELHDYVDANVYGGMCDDGFPERFGPRYDGPDDPMVADPWMVHCNEVQDIVHAWLVAGRPTTTTTTTESE